MKTQFKNVQSKYSYLSFYLLFKGSVLSIYTSAQNVRRNICFTTLLKYHGLVASISDLSRQTIPLFVPINANQNSTVDS